MKGRFSNLRIMRLAEVKASYGQIAISAYKGIRAEKQRPATRPASGQKKLDSQNSDWKGLQGVGLQPENLADRMLVKHGCEQLTKLGLERKLFLEASKLLDQLKKFGTSDEQCPAAYGS
eukprot:1152286-Pelagomonas_calceolata.AAC.2